MACETHDRFETEILGIHRCGGGAIAIQKLKDGGTRIDQHQHTEKLLERDTSCRLSGNESKSAYEGEIMSDQEMQAELERLRAENAQLKNKDKGGVTLKVSEKGAVSLYGMGRFPVTLYKEQWLRILGNASEIEAFIRDNESRLKPKE
jgi:hypothetical protein